MSDTNFDNVIILIKPNKYEYKHKTMDKKLILGDISKIIEVITIPDSDLMITICDILNLNGDVIGSTDIIYENLHNVVHMCHYKKEGIQDEEDDSFNSLASIYCQKKIFGNAVILNAKILLTDYKCVSESMTVDMLVDIFYKKHLHKGIIVKVNGEVTEYEYHMSPLETPCVKRDKEYQIIKFNIFNFYVNAIFMSNCDDEINKVATRLICKRTFGTVYFSLKSSETEYVDLNLELFMEIFSKASGKISKRIVNNDEEKENKDNTDRRPVIKNGYCILNQIQDTIICDRCGEQDNLKTCVGCYRAFYDCAECQQKDWELIHKSECAQNLNGIIKKKV